MHLCSFPDAMIFHTCLCRLNSGREALFLSIWGIWGILGSFTFSFGGSLLHFLPLMFFMLFFLLSYRPCHFAVLFGPFFFVSPSLRLFCLRLLPYFPWIGGGSDRGISKGSFSFQLLHPYTLLGLALVTGILTSISEANMASFFFFLGGVVF